MCQGRAHGNVCVQRITEVMECDRIIYQHESIWHNTMTPSSLSTLFAAIMPVVTWCDLCSILHYWFRSSGIWCWVIGWAVPGVLKDCSASSSRVMGSYIWDVLILEVSITIHHGTHVVSQKTRDVDSLKMPHPITVQLAVILLKILPFSSLSDVSERWCALAVCSSG